MYKVRRMKYFRIDIVARNQFEVASSPRNVARDGEVSWFFGIRETELMIGHIFNSVPKQDL